MHSCPALSSASVRAQHGMLSAYPYVWCMHLSQRFAKSKALCNGTLPHEQVDWRCAHHRSIQIPEALHTPVLIGFLRKYKYIAIMHRRHGGTHSREQV